MAEDRDALLEHYRGMRRELLAAIEGLDDALMAEPSIDGWSVKDHLAHVALWDDLRAGEVARISAGYGSAWRMDGDQDETFSAIGHALRQGMSVDQARWELATSHRRLLDAIAAATPRGLDGALYGEAGLRSTHEAAHAAWIRSWRRVGPFNPPGTGRPDPTGKSRADRLAHGAVLLQTAPQRRPGVRRPDAPRRSGTLSRPRRAAGRRSWKRSGTWSTSRRRSSGTAATW